jgi:hypothetical protein
MVIQSRRCRDPQCNREIIYSVVDAAFINVDEPDKGKLHKITCHYRPNYIKSAATENPAGLVLVGNSEFKQAVDDISNQFRATQRSVNEVKCMIQSLIDRRVIT